MGILDSLKGQIFGGGNKENALINAVVSILGNQQSGGLAGLVEQLSGKGLGDIVNSWVSTGKNLPVTPEQLQEGLGDTMVRKIASQAGISTDQVTSQLSKLLPQIVDKLTPNGKISQTDIMTKGTDLLKGLLK
jgi:uncharacterized protein YidB (DUF937 family)